MLTAAQAREIVDGSGVIIQGILDREFSEQIKNLAEQGKREFFWMISSKEAYQHLPTLNGKCYAILEKLKVLGYTVKYESYGESYIPRGLQDDYDSSKGPMHTNYGLIVRW